MIQIQTIKGDLWEYNQETDRIFKNGYMVPSSLVEAIFSSGTSDSPPEFSGIHLKDSNEIISRSGNINSVTDPNTI